MSVVAVFLLKREITKMRVLVADDDEDVRQAIIDLATDCLGLKPEDIQKCWNGAQALHAYRRRGPFDLVITDNEMPVMKGVDFCRELVKLEEQPKAIIMITGSSRSDLKGLPEQVQLFTKGRPLEELQSIIKKAAGVE
jgi:CheY-like chemotaxis protein